MAPEEQAEPVDPAPSPLSRLQSARDLALLERLLARLPHEQREILLLREVEGLAYDELAATLQLNAGTVKSRLAPARRCCTATVRPTEAPSMTEHLDMAILSAYLDNELDAAEQRHADGHLAVCPQCRATLAELDGLGQGLRALACPELPAGLQARLQRPLRRHPRAAGGRATGRRGIGAAASVLLSACCSATPLPGQPSRSSPSHDLLAVLGSAPPALCARPEFCYLKVNLK